MYLYAVFTYLSLQEKPVNSELQTTPNSQKVLTNTLLVLVFFVEFVGNRKKEFNYATLILHVCLHHHSQ